MCIVNSMYRFCLDCNKPVDRRSIRCRSCNMRSRPHRKLSDEHKKKLSVAMSKRRLSEIHKQRIGLAHRGRKMPREAVERIRLKRIGVKMPQISGDKHPNWKGGKWLNKEWTDDYFRKWRKNNSIKRNLYNKERKLRGTVSRVLTDSEWFLMKCKFLFTCPSCFSNQLPLTMDHIVPLKLGGNSSPDNIQPLCMKCNSSKRLKIMKFSPMKLLSYNQ